MLQFVGQFFALDMSFLLSLPSLDLSLMSGSNFVMSARRKISRDNVIVNRISVIKNQTSHLINDN